MERDHIECSLEGFVFSSLLSNNNVLMAKEKEPTKSELETDEMLDQADQQPTKRSSGMFILLGMIIVILLLATSMALILPGPGAVRKELISLEDGNFVADYQPLPSTTGETPPMELVEKDLGDKFQVQELSTQRPGETDLFSVSITLLVDKKSEAEFDKIYATRTKTVRGAIQTILRASTLEERRQDSLGSIKQKIVRQVNEKLGGNFIKDVVCTDVSLGVM